MAEMAESKSKLVRFPDYHVKCNKCEYIETRHGDGWPYYFNGCPHCGEGLLQRVVVENRKVD